MRSSLSFLSCFLLMKPISVVTVTFLFCIYLPAFFFSSCSRPGKTFTQMVKLFAKQDVQKVCRVVKAFESVSVERISQMVYAGSVYLLFSLCCRFRAHLKDAKKRRRRVSLTGQSDRRREGNTVDPVLGQVTKSHGKAAYNNNYTKLQTYCYWLQMESTAMQWRQEYPGFTGCSAVWSQNTTFLKPGHQSYGPMLGLPLRSPKSAGLIQHTEPV